jgi:hypothetical protein
MIHLLNYGRIRPPIISSPARNKKRAHPSTIVSERSEEIHPEQAFSRNNDGPMQCNATCTLNQKPWVGWRPAGARRARAVESGGDTARKAACMHESRQSARPGCT